VDSDTELSDIMRAVATKSVELLNNFKQQPVQLPMLIEKYINVSSDFQALMTTLINNPEQVVQMQMAYWQDAMGLLQEHLNHWLEGRTKPITDKRFSSEEWVNNPFFNLLSQQYLLASEHINSLLEHLEYGDKQLAIRAQFLMRQYLDALSPDNFFHTNPQLMAETIQSHGKNLLRGLQNLLTDMDSGSSRLIIKMTDMGAFEPGKNIAITPGNVIFKNELMELIQYTPQTPKVNSVPLLIIPPWINKYYILDLSPHNSFIRWLVTQGITVFVISWFNPDASYAKKGIYDYLNEGPITAINTIKKQLHVRQVNALGFCIGGTLLAMLLAYYKAHNKKPIRSATFLAAMIDFSHPGDIAVFIDEKQISSLEEKMNEKGYLEGHFMASAFNSLRASDLIWSFFIKNYLRGKAPVPFDILYWNADTTNMPAKMHSQYLRWMYLHNDLIKPGKIHLNNTPLDISKIDTPTFFVSTKKDHIAPWKTTYLGFQLLQGKKRFLLGGSGHIAGIIMPPGSDKYGFYRNLYCQDNAEDWLENAKYHSGSWWPEWLDWLKKESGRLVDAPEFAKLPFPPLMAAPGSYVRLSSKEKQEISD
jgi:polyhydroxyalkanoate synthase